MATALLACASVVGSALPVCAQSELVLLFVPRTPDPALVELFHRVEAELRLHAFQTEVLVASPEDSAESLLGAQASAKRAFAAVEIVEQAAHATLHIWIVNARTGLTRDYLVEQQGGQEPTNVVAVRAVDLLRAHRNAPAEAAPGAGAASQPSAATAPARSAAAAGSTQVAGDGAGSSQPSKARPSAASGTPAAQAEAQQQQHEDAQDEAPEQESTFANSDLPSTFRYLPTWLQLAVEVTGLSLSRRLSWSFGPSLGAFFTLGAMRLGVVAAAPLAGAVLHAPLGDATIWQQLLWLEVGARLVRAGPLQLSAAAGGGLHWLQAKGPSVPFPYESVDESNWSWTASLAGRADIMLAEHWSLGFTLRARVFLPPVEVAVAQESARLATPALEGALGLSFWL